MTEVTHSHCLVIGGTRGIGRVTARLLAARGAQVTVVARRVEGTDVGEVPRISLIAGDIAAPEALLPALETAIASRGPLTGLVFSQRFRGDASDSWAGELETSVTATNRMIERLAGRFSPRGGSIVVITSNAARNIGLDQSAGYHVARAALEQLVRYHAVAQGRLGIRVNAVAPSAIRREDPGCPPGASDELARVFERIAPLGRLGVATDVAGAVSFLLSDDASFITGQTLTVDGGSSLVRHDQLARDLAAGKE